MKMLRRALEFAFVVAAIGFLGSLVTVQSVEAGASQSSNPNKLRAQRLFGWFFQVDNTTEAKRTVSVDVGDTSTVVTVANGASTGSPIVATSNDSGLARITLGDPDTADEAGVVIESDSGDAVVASDQFIAYGALDGGAFLYDFNAGAGTAKRFVPGTLTLSGGAGNILAGTGRTFVMCNLTSNSGSVNNAPRGTGIGTRTFAVTLATGGTEVIGYLCITSGALS